MSSSPSLNCSSIIVLFGVIALLLLLSHYDDVTMSSIPHPFTRHQCPSAGSATASPVITTSSVAPSSPSAAASSNSAAATNNNENTPQTNTNNNQAPNKHSNVVWQKYAELSDEKSKVEKEMSDVFGGLNITTSLNPINPSVPRPRTALDSSPAYPSCQRQATFISACNSHYYPAVLNMIGSVIKHILNDSLDSKPYEQYGGRVNIIVWDLGMTEEEVKHLNSICHVKVEKFKYEDYPDHARDLHTYAFKPISMYMTFQLYPEISCIFFVDSGCTIEADYPIWAPDVLRDTDIYGSWHFATGWDFPNMYTHQNVFNYFQLPRNQFDGKGYLEAAGGVAGYKRGSVAFDMLLVPWYKCALIKACISPDGTDRSNNRQDQTALGFLMYHPDPNQSFMHYSRTQIYPHLPEPDRLRAHNHLPNHGPPKDESTVFFPIHTEMRYYQWQETPEDKKSDPEWWPLMLLTSRGPHNKEYYSSAKSCTA